MTQTTPLRILMVHYDPCIRVLKQTTALRDAGMHVDLLCKDLENHKVLANHVENVFYFTSVYDLREFLARRHTEWDIIHCHNEPNDFIAAAIGVCRERPVIYDCHDLSSIRGVLPEIHAAMERFCFTHAAGVVHVCDELKKHTYKKFGPHPSLVLHSLPSVKDIAFTPKPKLPGNHVVYQGGLLDLPTDRFSYRFYYPIFRRLCEAGIHVHAFRARHNRKESLPFCVELAKSNPYFHLYDPLPYAELIAEISRFQWGLAGFSAEGLPKRSDSLFMETALPNKLFDYIVAGVCPVVLNNEPGAALARRLHVGYAAKDVDDFIRICTTEKPLPPLPDLSPVDMNAQIQRLIAFYKAIQSSGYEERRAFTRPFHDFVSLPVTKRASWRKSALPPFAHMAEAPFSSLFDMLMAQYNSGSWLFRNESRLALYTAADTHALFLSALCRTRKADPAQDTTDAIRNIADMLLTLDRAYQGGKHGWGLGFDSAALEKEAGEKSERLSLPPNAENTVDALTSSVTGLALLAAYEATGDKVYLTVCSRLRETLVRSFPKHPVHGGFMASDHPVVATEYSAWRPYPAFMALGFLSRYGAAAGTAEDAGFIRDMLAGCMKWHDENLPACNDALSLAFALEGLYLIRDAVPDLPYPEETLKKLIAVLFHAEYQIREKDDPIADISGQGAALGLMTLMRFNAPVDCIIGGMECVRTNPHIAFSNIRASGAYANLLSYARTRAVE